MKLNVNGEACELDIDPSTPLIYVLRNDLGLKGTKLGCGLEQCGACAVLVDGEAALSCSRAASEFEGQEIVTVEGLGENAVQKAFITENAAQCGYCTTGLIVAATALLARTRKPSRAEIVAALDKHLCRCGSHTRVLKAIARAAESANG